MPRGAIPAVVLSPIGGTTDPVWPPLRGSGGWLCATAENGGRRAIPSCTDLSRLGACR